MESSPDVSLLETEILQLITSPNCNDKIFLFREKFNFIDPLTRKKAMINVVSYLNMLYPRIHIESIYTLVHHLFDDQPEMACGNVEKLIKREIEIQDQCAIECLQEIEISMFELLKVVKKCKFWKSCYIDEIQDEAKKFYACARECYAKFI